MLEKLAFGKLQLGERESIYRYLLKVVQRDPFLKLDHFAVQQISSISCNIIEPFATPLRETKAKHINYEGNLQWRIIFSKV